jgi:hypothetical protein
MMIDSLVNDVSINNRILFVALMGLFVVLQDGVGFDVAVSIALQFVFFASGLVC